MKILWMPRHFMIWTAQDVENLLKQGNVLNVGRLQKSDNSFAENVGQKFLRKRYLLSKPVKNSATNVDMMPDFKNPYEDS